MVLYLLMDRHISYYNKLKREKLKEDALPANSPPTISNTNKGLF